MTRARLKTFLKSKTALKTVEIEKFLGLEECPNEAGRLIECDNVSVLRSGALKSLLREERIDVGTTPDIAGIYTYSSYYDKQYETYISPNWVYENVCPQSTLNYTDGLENTSRMFVIENGYKGKTEEGYSNVLASFVEDGTIYVLYDAALTIIDQRRSCETTGALNGIIVQFRGSNKDEGESTTVYNVKQLWIDIIKDGEVTSALVSANLKKRATVTSNVCGKSTMFCEFGEDTYRYLSPDYCPSIEGSYSLAYDKVYLETYPSASTYTPAAAEERNCRLVRYRNRAESADAFSEKFVLLPDMQIIKGGDTWTADVSSMPSLDGAVQHFERLFGFKGERLYASVKGDCTDFTEGVDNLPISSGWQTVTSDKSGFTSIASFDGKVVAFTDKSMMTVKGTDLPFSLSYIGAYGCKSPEAITVCGGYLYFATHGGIMRYNGSRVESISEGLSKNLEFADAKLNIAKGILIAEFPSFKGFYLFNPESECWTYQTGDYISSIMPTGDGGVIARKYNGGYKLYNIFSSESDFAFSFYVGGGRRERIRTITVTASVKNGHLSLLSEDGVELFRLTDTGGRVATQGFMPKNMYVDREELRFSGSGNVSVYSVFIEYKEVRRKEKQ